MSEKHCSGCGDEYPLDFMFEGERGHWYCAWICLGVDPDVDTQLALDMEDYSPEKIEQMFWEEFRKK